MPFEPLAWIGDELAKLEREHLLREPALRGSDQGPEIVWNGQKYVNFGSNDYLGLAADPRIREPIVASLKTNGWGSGASPLITGRSSRHAELERHLAAFEQTEAALLFPSGYAANVGTVTSLAQAGDAIFSDEKNHASLIDGCRLSRASVEVYRHGDTDSLRKRLASASSARRRVVVTESLFSMDGDLAPLPELVQLAEEYRAILVVDEAHATGVFGESGRGVCEHLGLESVVPVRVGTLSKALGSIGGFVVGSKILIQWLFNRARPYVYSTAPPAAFCTAGLAALRIVRDEPQRRQTLLRQAAELRAGLVDQNWSLGDSASQILPLIVRRPDRALRLSAALRESGLFVPAIRPPSVGIDESRLRISLTSGHSAVQIQRLLERLAELRRGG